MKMKTTFYLFIPGEIDFNDYIQWWYASEKCQDYSVTVQTERIHARLKAKLQTTLKQKQQQLRHDCNGASRELIVLLQECYSKQRAEKVLLLHNQDVIFPRHCLEERLYKKRMCLQKEAQVKALKRREKFQKVSKRLHVLLCGENKKTSNHLEI